MFIHYEFIEASILMLYDGCDIAEKRYAGCKRMLANLSMHTIESHGASTASE
jgi:hypothetical protein